MSKMQYSSKKKAIYNVLLNAVATFVPLAVLQLAILPGINRQIGETSYGLTITLISLINMIPSGAGGALNNVRLLSDMDYTDNGITGDFNLISLIMSALSTLLTVVAAAGYISDWVTILEMAALAILVFINQYYIVGFLIKLEYKKVLFTRLLMVLGYIVGYQLFKLYAKWTYIYILGYGISDIYILLRSGLIRERWRFTSHAKATAVSTLLLFISSLMISAVTYIDRLVLYPLLGGTTVTVYYVATLLGKLISVAMGPITSVLLSYLSKLRTLSANRMKQLILSGIVVGAVGYIVCIFISRPILSYLYPKVVDEAIPYIYITMLTCAVGLICSLVNPVVLRFYETKWQLVLGGTNLVVYFVFSLVLLKLYGLMGFCIGALVATVVKLIIMLAIYRKKGECKETAT